MKNLPVFSKTDIEQYFVAEKRESLFFLCIGIVSVAGALLSWFLLKQSVWKGAAVPMLIVGLLLSVVGYTVYQRSDGDRIRNVYAYDMNPSQLRNQELPRMRTVMKNFVIYRYTEIFLLLAGTALFLYFYRNEAQAFWRGFGISLAALALIALIADGFAERRGKIYTDGLISFTSKQGS